jgi:hypothetical protein
MAMAIKQTTPRIEAAALEMKQAQLALETARNELRNAYTELALNSGYKIGDRLYRERGRGRVRTFEVVGFTEYCREPALTLCHLKKDGTPGVRTTDEPIAWANAYTKIISTEPT